MLTHMACSERWAGAEWRREAEAWIRSVLAAHDLQLTSAIEQPLVRPWSTHLTAPTDAGALWFKENCPGQGFEASLLAVLADTVPDAVVAPLAVDGERGWSLTPDHGETFHDRVADVDLWADVVCQWADVQRRLSPHSERLLAAGVAKMPPAEAGDYLSARIEAHAALPAGDPAQLAQADAERLRALVPDVAAWGARLDAGPLPLTLDHNDLHANNVFVPRPGEKHLRFFDLADSVMAHPLGSLLVPLNLVSHTLEAPPDDARLRRLVDAYLEVWSGVAAAHELRPLVEPALSLARLNRHESWRRVLATVSAEELAELGYLQPRWLKALLDPLPVSL